MLKRFPDYLFGRLAYARDCLERGDLDKVSEIFEGKFDLKLLYPDRERFHVSEVLNSAPSWPGTSMPRGITTAPRCTTTSSSKSIPNTKRPKPSSGCSTPRPSRPGCASCRKKVEFPPDRESSAWPVHNLQQNNQVAATGIKPPRRFAPPLLSQGGEKIPDSSLKDHKPAGCWLYVLGNGIGQPANRSRHSAGAAWSGRAP